MNKKIFKLISTYEYIVEINSAHKPVRVEVFQAVDSVDIYRARVWIQNMYNVYPTFLNTDENGSDLRKVHSCDELNTEITSNIAENERLILGEKYKSEKVFLDYVHSGWLLSAPHH